MKTEVAEQGEGIAADELASLFQPFHTTKNKTTAGEKSTGLGLSIAKKSFHFTEAVSRLKVRWE